MTITEALEKFCVRMTEEENARKARDYPKAFEVEEAKAGFDLGPTNARIWLGQIHRPTGAMSSRSAKFFVVLATGEIHRADSWKQKGRPLGRNILKEVE